MTINDGELAQLFGVGGPIHQSLGEYARRVQTAAQQINPTNTRTGAYRGGFFTESRGGGESWEYVVGNTAPHAGYIEAGTRPHTITPKRGRYLVFAGDGGTVFARKVNHPGTPAHHVLQRALESTPYR